MTTMGGSHIESALICSELNASDIEANIGGCQGAVGAAVALAWVLSSVVTPAAFGWSFSLRPEWSHLPVLVLMAAGALVLAILLPSLHLLRTSPAHLLREQTT